MYCVKCGVKLRDNVEACPLCGTPVWNPEVSDGHVPPFPQRYPEKDQPRIKLAVAIILTVLMGLAAFVVWLIASHLGGIWGGITLLGIALAYLVIVFPLWFHSLHPAVYLPLIHAGTAGFLIYLCVVTGGHWFLSFAFPLVMLPCLILTATAVLLKHLKHGRFYIFGGMFILLGGATMLIEFFAHITFKIPMFLWSIYSCSVLAAFGLFLILAGCIKPLKDVLEKNFFF